MKTICYRFVVLALLSVLPVSFAKAEILFEAYYRIEHKGEHSGYLLQQRTKQPGQASQTLRYYILRKTANGFERNAVESVVGKDWSPTAMKSWTKNQNLTARSHATFSKNSVKVQYLGADDKKVLRDETLKRVKGTSLSGFWFNQLQGKNPNWTGVKKYEAFIEESLKFAKGETRFRGQSEFAGQNLRHIEDSLMNEEIEFFTFPSGDIAGSRSEDQSRVVYLVKDQKTAIGELPFHKEEIMQHFAGRIPDGKSHPLNEVTGLKEWILSIPSSIQRRVSSTFKAGGR